MRNEYHHDILEILSNAGPNGLQVRLIALQIYNRRTGLFCNAIDFNKLYASIRFYLWSQTQRPASPFMRGPSKGSYMLKPWVHHQMHLSFHEKEIIKEETAEQSGTFLPSLFDEFDH